MIKIKKIISGLIRSDLSVEHIYDMIESDIETKPPKLVTESGVLTKVCIVCSLFSFFSYDRCLAQLNRCSKSAQFIDSFL